MPKDVYINKPLIAALNGVALGVGLSMVLPCDIRIAWEKARLGAPFLRAGLIPEFGSTFLLPLLVGPSSASELILTRKTIDAQEAFQIRLLNKVVPHERSLVEALELAKDIAEGPPSTSSYAKEGFRRNSISQLKEALEWEAKKQRICRESAEYNEGINAILEKRMPKFYKL